MEAGAFVAAPVGEGEGLDFFEGREAGFDALVEQHEDGGVLGAEHVGAPFRFGQLAGEAEGFRGDLGVDRRVGDFVSGEGREFGALGLEPFGEGLRIGLVGLGRELVAQLFADLAGEVAEGAVGADDFLDIGTTGEGLFLDLAGLELELLGHVVAFGHDFIIGDRGSIGFGLGEGNHGDLDLGGEAVGFLVGFEGGLGLGLVVRDGGLEAGVREGRGVDGPERLLALDEALDLGGGGVARAGEQGDGLVHAPGVLEVNFETSARLGVGGVEGLGGVVDKLIEVIEVFLAVGTGGREQGELADFAVGWVRDVERVGEAEFGDELEERTAFIALPREAREGEGVAVARLELGVVQVIPEVHPGIRIRRTIVAIAVEHEGADDHDQQDAEDQAVVLGGGALEPGNHPATLVSPLAAVNQSRDAPLRLHRPDFRSTLRRGQAHPVHRRRRPKRRNRARRAPSLAYSRGPGVVFGPDRGWGHDRGTRLLCGTW